MTRPTRSTVGGRAYLDLQNLARRTGRPTDELLTRFVLERFLYRLARSAQRDRFVLKGGMLLEVFDVRRPTRDVDLLARSTANDPAVIGALMAEIAGVKADDGVVFRAEQLTSEVIREDDAYASVRVRMPAALDRARTTLSLDVSVGDPVSPAALRIEFPTLLDAAGFELLSYPLPTVLAEKIETMTRRGDANTRDRDFADVWLLITRHEIDARELRTALLATASHRGTALVPLSQAVVTLGATRQQAWTTFRRRTRLDTLPADLNSVLADIARFVNPVIASDDDWQAKWNPTARSWSDRPVQKQRPSPAERR